jgi:undecaprenyl-diphosphatase
MVWAFFISHRTDCLSTIALAMTYLGNSLVVIALALLFAIYFYRKGFISRSFSLLVAVAGSALTTYAIKHLVNRSRPPLADMLLVDTSPSFPSGHATVAMALYGFLIYLLWSYSITTERAKYSKKIILLVIFLSILIILIGASRLYLGVHYLSDVLVGYAIGLTWILLSRLIARSKIWHLLDGGHPL